MHARLSNSGQIRVRHYRASDEQKVRDLVYASMIGDDSASFVSMREQWTTRTSLMCYLTIILGIRLGVMSQKPMSRFIALAFASLGGMIFVWYRQTLDASNTEYIGSCLNGDLSNISNNYGMAVMDTLSPDNLCPTGMGGFWVAEIYEGGSTLIVGCVGLDANTIQCNGTTAELRRMHVSREYRRKGIGKLLIATLIEHARNQNVKAILLTASVYQKTAISMYRKIGWELKDEQKVPLFLFETFNLYNFELDTNKCHL